ncbi:MAG: zinc-ribbon domain-containing protein [Holophagaceae bacterium]|nr:zinc-ribbon domain-containing protein [Holophagaceae bacterium]
MIVVCPSCAARFQYDEARFEGVRAKRFRCPKCSYVFEVMNPLVQSEVQRERTTRMDPSQIPTRDPDVQIIVSGQIPGRPGDIKMSQSLVPVRESQPLESMSQAPSHPNRDDGETTAKRDRQAMLAEAGLGKMPPGMRFSLAFLSGPHASTVKVLDKPKIIIGREGADISTMDPETSRLHSSLEIHNDGVVYLTDLDSTNGTFVDGIPITGPVQIGDRQEFSCGKSTFMLLVRKDDLYGME